MKIPFFFLARIAALSSLVIFATVPADAFFGGMYIVPTGCGTLNLNLSAACNSISIPVITQ